MMDDAELLHRHASTGAQDAFAEIVRRHVGLVYHAALRQTGGDPHRAQDVAQTVFTDLARKAASLARHPHLVAWLHTATRLAAVQLRRAEARRLAREQAAFAMNAADASPAGDTAAAAADWERLRPLIDDALDCLPERDRAAVLLRFFEERSYAEVASALAVSEDAARVRVNRALEKLRSALARRGLVSTASALGLALAQPALAATPPGLAATVATASLSAASASTAATLGAGALAATTVMSTAKITLAAAGAALAVFSLGVAVRSSSPPSAPVPAAPAPALSAAELAAILAPTRLSPADAETALAAYLALPALPADATEADTAARAVILRRLLVVLPAASHERLLSATAPRPGWPEARLRRLAFTAWTELDAPAAARWIAAQPPGPGIDAKARQNLATAAALLWASASFDPAYEWAASLSDLRAPLLRALLIQLAPAAPNRALELARAQGDEFSRSVMRDLFAAWAKKDPASAVRTLGAALYEPGHNSDNWALTQALAAWGRAEPVAALDWLFAQTHQSREDNHELLRRMVGQATRGGSPAALADALRTHSGLADPAETLGSLLNAWAEADSRAALAWLDRLPDPAERVSLATEALNMWSSDHPENNLPLALHLPAGPQRSSQVAKILERWAKISPDAALAWTRARPQPEFAKLAASLEGARLGETARVEPAAALASWQNLPSGPAKTAAANAIASAWGERDPAAAARWWLAHQPAALDTARLAQPFVSDQTLTPLLAAWSRRDPDALLAWAAEQKATAPDLAIHAIRTLYQDFNHEDLDAPDAPSTAARLARIDDQYPNLMLLENHFRGWSARDPAAARAWLDAAEAIPPERAARILQHMSPVAP